LVALPTVRATQFGANSRHLPTPSPKHRPALAQVRARLGSSYAGPLKIDWPHDLGRIREVISRSGTRRRFVVPCFRFGDREAHCEAAEEAAACILLDACAGVEFQEQPARLTFHWRGEARQHIPDLIVVSPKRCEFWECKRAEESDGFWIRKRSETLRELLAPLQIGYRVVSGLELLAASYLINAKLLRRFAKHPISRSVAIEAKALLAHHGALTIQQLAGTFRSVSPACDVMAMIYRGDVHVDFANTLTSQSVLYPPSDDRSTPWVWRLFGPDRS